jgi:NIPSNAP protein
MQNRYDVTIITVRPATHPKALSVLERVLMNDPGLLACWYSEIGALNQILIIRSMTDPKAELEARMAVLKSKSPFEVGEFMTGMTMDTFIAFDFLPPMQPGAYGPFYEVRSYVLKTGGLEPTIELWRKAVPARNKISPLLTAMSSVTGAVTRFTHIWPYKSLEERGRLRAKAMDEGVWPPPGGPDQLAVQQTDIYLPASFSPIR